MSRDFDESVLNSFEVKNLGLILQHEKALTGYIISDSDSRYLTVMDLLGLSDEESCLARNEIFARHNRLFDLAWIQEYFDGCPWYAGHIRPDQFDSDIFSDIEKANIDTIQAYEARFD